MNKYKTAAWRKKQYVDRQRSLSDIAKELGVPVSTLRRKLIKDGIKLRNKSEAQKAALNAGRSAHPTEGKAHSDETRLLISEKVAENWESLSKQELKRRSEQTKQQWENTPKHKRQEILKMARDAARKTLETGSKLENFLKKGLTDSGYVVQCYIRGLMRKDFEVDIYLPEAGVVIEVDGPSHFEPIWGPENLRSCERSDKIKDSTLLDKHFAVIRVQQKSKSISEKVKRNALSRVLEKLNEIKAAKEKPTTTVIIEV